MDETSTCMPHHTTPHNITHTYTHTKKTSHTHTHAHTHIHTRPLPSVSGYSAVQCAATVAAARRPSVPAFAVHWVDLQPHALERGLVHVQPVVLPTVLPIVVVLDLLCTAPHRTAPHRKGKGATPTKTHNRKHVNKKTIHTWRNQQRRAERTSENTRQAQRGRREGKRNRSRREQYARRNLC